MAKLWIFFWWIGSDLFWQFLINSSLIGRFSCENTTVVFDSKFLLPNLSSKDYSRLNIGKSFKMRKKTDLKVPYKLQLNNKSNNNDRRIIIKILKMTKITSMVMQWQNIAQKIMFFVNDLISRCDQIWPGLVAFTEEILDWKHRKLKKNSPRGKISTFCSKK